MLTFHSNIFFIQHKSYQWSALPGGSRFPARGGFYQLLFHLCFVCFLFPHTHKSAKHYFILFY